MIYSMIFGALLLIAIPVGCVALLVYAYKKLPRYLFFILLVVLVGSPYACFKRYERNFMLSVVPDALHVHWITYRKEKSWGFGPGGNEAGIRVYALPEPVADKISAQGMSFFAHLPPNENQRERRSRGLYGAWTQTPVTPDRYWKRDETTGRLDIYDYICAYGFCIDIREDIVKEANDMINMPGSYYAYGRTGMILVNPERKRVLYFYNG